MPVLMLALLFNSLYVFSHGDEDHSVPTKKEKPVTDLYVHKKIKEGYEAKIQPIFGMKCFNCHSAETKYPWYYKLPIVSQIMDSHIKEARSHLDMTKGYPFRGHGSPQGDLKAIIKVIEKDKMPPWYYTPFHANSELNENEKKLILSWAHTSLNELEKKERK